MLGLVPQNASKTLSETTRRRQVEEQEIGDVGCEHGSNQQGKRSEPESSGGRSSAGEEEDFGENQHALVDADEQPKSSAPLEYPLVAADSLVVRNRIPLPSEPWLVPGTDIILDPVEGGVLQTLSLSDALEESNGDPLDGAPGRNKKRNGAPGPFDGAPGRNNGDPLDGAPGRNKKRNGDPLDGAPGRNKKRKTAGNGPPVEKTENKLSAEGGFVKKSLEKSDEASNSKPAPAPRKLSAENGAFSAGRLSTEGRPAVEEASSSENPRRSLEYPSAQPPKKSTTHLIPDTAPDKLLAPGERSPLEKSGPAPGAEKETAFVDQLMQLLQQVKQTQSLNAERDALERQKEQHQQQRKAWEEEQQQQRKAWEEHQQQQREAWEEHQQQQRKAWEEHQQQQQKALDDKEKDLEAAGAVVAAGEAVCEKERAKISEDRAALKAEQDEWEVERRILEKRAGRRAAREAGRTAQTAGDGHQPPLGGQSGGQETHSTVAMAKEEEKRLQKQERKKEKNLPREKEAAEQRDQVSPEKKKKKAKRQREEQEKEIAEGQKSSAAVPQQEVGDRDPPLPSPAGKKKKLKRGREGEGVSEKKQKKKKESQGV